jgi:glucosamine--fructose-6-phosphate aminotransferase (isomerizing)
MCGIVGIIASNNSKGKVIDFSLEGLKKLEYRGYDSAGVITINNHKFLCFKEQGKIRKLEEEIANFVEQSNIDNIYSQINNGLIAIGHTRWATHGKPSKINAHPHYNSKIAVVHNGIIENYQELKAELISNNINFSSESDSEVIPHLILYFFNIYQDKQKAINLALSKLKGSFALAIIFSDDNSKIYLAKRGSPLIIGIGDRENFISSDYQAIAHRTNKIIALQDNQSAVITADNIAIYDSSNQIIPYKIKEMAAIAAGNDKGDFPHFMLKEIYEQPRVILETIENYIDLENYQINLPKFDFDINKIEKIVIIACGTSFYAAMAGKYIIEKYAKINVEIDIASEFRYREAVFVNNQLNIFISQSGETADTIAALKYCQERNQKTLAIVNVAISSMAEIADSFIRTIAGPEIGVASTKCYIAQLLILSIMAIDFADKKSKINQEEKIALIKQIIDCNHYVAKIIDDSNILNIKKIAKKLSSVRNILFIGRNIASVSANEAALKMRELSYINSVAIAAGELKHGTIALIDENIMVVAIGSNSNSQLLIEKTISNIEEVVARNGKVIFIADKDSVKQIEHLIDDAIIVPKVSNIIQEAIVPIVATQLLAYFVAVNLGNDVDQPRNLAKSVTVE